MAGRPEVEFSVKVSGISGGVRSNEVRSIVEQAGYTTITDVYFPDGKPFGFVRFASDEEANDFVSHEILEIRGQHLGLELSTGGKKQSHELAARDGPLFGKGGCGKAAGYGKGGAASFDSWGGKGGYGPAFDASPSKGSKTPFFSGAASKGSAKQSLTEHSVHVGNLPVEATSEDLRQLFISCGVETMTDVYIPAGRGFGFVRFASFDEVHAALEMCEGLAFGDSLLELKASSTEKRGGTAPAALGGGGPIIAGPPAKGSKGGWGPGGLGSDGYGGWLDAMYSYSAAASGYGDSSGGYGPAAAKKSGRGEHSIWVGGLPSGSSAEELQEAFLTYGVSNMTDVYVPPGKDFGFVRFQTVEEVDAALGLVEGLQLGGVVLELKASVTEKQRASESPAIGIPTGWDGGKGAKSAGVGIPTGCHPWDVGKGWGASAGWGPGKGLGKGAGKGHVDNGKPSNKLSSGEHSVWVGNLPDTVTTDMLQEAFLSRGIDTMTDVYIPPAKGFGFVRFATREEVEFAVGMCEGLVIGGVEVELKSSQQEKRGPVSPISSTTLEVALSAGKGCGWGSGSKGDAAGGLAGMGASFSSGGKGNRPPSEVSVKVGNLSPGTTSEELGAAFMEAGVENMTDVYIPRSGNFGFLRFARLSDAHVALACEGIIVGSSQVTLELSEGEKKSAETMALESMGVKGSSIALKGGKGAGPMSFSGKGRDMPMPAVGKGGEASIKVGNLPPDISVDELRQAFIEHGVDSMTDCYIPQGRQFGFVRFSSVAEGKFALNHSIVICGKELEMEFAESKKKSSEEMAGGVWQEPQPASRQALAKGSPMVRGGKGAPDNPKVSEDAPSLKVSSVPAGTSSDELHKAVLAAGCRGGITDVYVPKGDRGFGFVRFSSMREAEAASYLQVFVRGVPVGLEISVAQRKGPKEMAGQGFGADPFGFDFGGFGPGKGCAGGKMGPFSGKASKAFW